MQSFSTSSKKRQNERGNRAPKKSKASHCNESEQEQSGSSSGATPEQSGSSSGTTQEQSGSSSGATSSACDTQACRNGHRRGTSSSIPVLSLSDKTIYKDRQKNCKLFKKYGSNGNYKLLKVFHSDCSSDCPIDGKKPCLLHYREGKKKGEWEFCHLTYVRGQPEYVKFSLTRKKEHHLRNLFKELSKRNELNKIQNPWNFVVVVGWNVTTVLSRQKFEFFFSLISMSSTWFMTSNGNIIPFRYHFLMFDRVIDGWFHFTEIEIRMAPDSMNILKNTHSWRNLNQLDNCTETCYKIHFKNFIPKSRTKWSTFNFFMIKF